MLTIRVLSLTVSAAVLYWSFLSCAVKQEGMIGRLSETVRRECRENECNGESKVIIRERNAVGVGLGQDASFCVCVGFDIRSTNNVDHSSPRKRANSVLMRVFTYSPPRNNKVLRVIRGNEAPHLERQRISRTINRYEGTQKIENSDPQDEQADDSELVTTKASENETMTENINKIETSNGSESESAKKSESERKSESENKGENKNENENEREGESNLPCRSVLTSLKYWGANMVVFANIVYIVPYLIIVAICAAVPSLRRRAYDGAVIGYNVAQIFLNGILIAIGWSLLCHKPLRPSLYAPLGLSIMFLTITSTSWLFVICFDMTLSITRFRWAPPSTTEGCTAAAQQRERRKFLLYLTWVVAGALVPTLLACIFELSPILPESSPIRPNFHKFSEGPNLAVIVYVTTIPALTCLANTLLFCYTTYRIIVIQRSSAVAVASSPASRSKSTSASSSRSDASANAKSRYFLFLRLYLLMDAPWITNALAAIFDDLWILKFLRMIQPMLMLIAILPRDTLTTILRVVKRKPANVEIDLDQQRRPHPRNRPT